MRSIGLRMYKGVKNVPDKKYEDHIYAPAVITTAGSVTDPLCKPLSGAGDNNRVGNHLTITNVGIKGTFEVVTAGYTDATAAPTHEKLRLMLVYDRQANGTSFSPTDVLATANVESFRNMDQLDRFVVLWDKTYDLGAEGSVYSAARIDGGGHISFNKKISLPVDFADDAGDPVAATIKTGALRMLRISRLGIVQCNYVVRTKYLDCYPYN